MNILIVKRKNHNINSSRFVVRAFLVGTTTTSQWITPHRSQLDRCIGIDCRKEHPSSRSSSNDDEGEVVVHQHQREEEENRTLFLQNNLSSNVKGEAKVKQVTESFKDWYRIASIVERNDKDSFNNVKPQHRQEQQQSQRPQEASAIKIMAGDEFVSSSSNSKQTPSSSSVESSLSSPRLWMEYIIKNHRKRNVASKQTRMTKQEKEEGIGSYTVIRCCCECEQSSSSVDNNNDWYVHGLDFHLNRLEESYRQYFVNKSDDCCDFQQARQDSLDMIHALLNEASSVIESEAKNKVQTNDSSILQEKNSCIGTSATTSSTTFVVMLTLLWTTPTTTTLTPSRCDDDNDDDVVVNHNNTTRTRQAPTQIICVRGHACFVPSPSQRTTTTAIKTSHMKPLSLPHPITVSLAVEPVSDKATTASISTTLEIQNLKPLSINRHEHIPTAKISSWCRDRRLIEELCKPQGSGIDEVLLVKTTTTQEQKEEGEEKSTAKLECLEGLTSNLFILYKDGTLRTASSDVVLNGYIRSRILNMLNKTSQHADHDVMRSFNSISVIEVAPRLEELDQWLVVFVTSSISILKPIERIVRPIKNENNELLSSDSTKSFQTLWESPVLTLESKTCSNENTATVARTFLQDLYNILTLPAS